MANDQVKFLKKHWVLNVTRNISVFSNAITTAGYMKNYKKFNVLPIEAIYITKRGRLSYAFTNIENIGRYSKNLEKLYKNPRLMGQMEKTYNIYGEALMKESSKLINKINRKNYSSYLNAVTIHFTGFQPTNVIGTYFSRILNEKLKNLRPDLSEQEIDILISDLTYPGRPTPLTQSQKVLLEIGVLLQKEKKSLMDMAKNPKVSRKFNYFMRRFSFIPVNFIDKPWTKEEVLAQLEKLMRKNCQKELWVIENNDCQRKNKSRRLLAEIDNQEISNLVKALQTGTYLNEYRKYVACYASLACRPIFREIANKYKLNHWEECWKLTPLEIEKVYFNNNTKILDVIKARNLAGICFSKNKEGYRLMTKREINIFMAVIDKKKVRNKNFVSGSGEIKGTIANKGIVCGSARIISGKNEFYKFKDGDIIVTAMTSVDFVPLMKRASAYVTNEGGITSHAAIVSRELDKPCIVGTKNATDILKDGDLVEVDANNGIVKIISRKEKTE